MNKITAKASDRFAKAVISFVLVLLTLFAPMAEIASDTGLFSVTAYADSCTYTYHPEKLAKSKTQKTGQVVRPADGYYVIVSGLSSNKAMDINGCATGYANVQLWSLNYSKAQVYYIEHVSGDWYRIVNVNSGMVIDVEGNSSTPGSNICQYRYNGQDNQLWRFRDAGNGYYYIESRLGELYIDVHQARTADGTNVKIWKFNDSTNAQKWKLVPYTSLSANSGSKSVKLNVPTLHQYDSKWANVHYVKSTTIKKSGCLLTCVTAVMSFLDGKSYRPDEYCKKLSFTSGGGLIWPSGWQRRSSLDLSVLKAQLDRGNPVIVGGKGKSGQHFVVVYGYSNGGSRAADFMIMDPGHSNSNLQQHINKYGQAMNYHV